MNLFDMKVPIDKQSISVKGLKSHTIRGYVDQHPIYGPDRNWSTTVQAGDTVECVSWGLGSGRLKMGDRFTLVWNEEEDELIMDGERGTLDGYQTWNTMPFFAKVR